MKLNLRNRQTIALVDLLRRRKTTLEVFVKTNGITTYELLVERCTRLGCIPPSPTQFNNLRQEVVSSPTEGIVVVEPQIVEPTVEVITDFSQEAPTSDGPVDSPITPIFESIGGTLERKRRKRSK